MTPYFLDDNHKNGLSNSLQSWIGTPYFRRVAVKGRGIDCTLLIGECLKECGVLLKINPTEFFPADWYKSTKSQFLIETVKSNFDTNLKEGLSYEYMEYKNDTKLIYGDVLAFNFSRDSEVISHTAFYTDNNTMTHSIVDREVCRIQLGHFLGKRMTYIFRIMEE